MDRRLGRAFELVLIPARGALPRVFGKRFLEVFRKDVIDRCRDLFLEFRAGHGVRSPLRHVSPALCILEQLGSEKFSPAVEA